MIDDTIRQRIKEAIQGKMADLMIEHGLHPATVLTVANTVVLMAIRDLCGIEGARFALKSNERILDVLEAPFPLEEEPQAPARRLN